MYIVAVDGITDIRYLCSCDDLEQVETVIDLLERVNQSRFDFYYGEVIEDSESITVMVDSCRKFVDVVIHILLADLGIVL